MKNTKLYIAILSIASFTFIGTVSAQYRHQDRHQDRYQNRQEYRRDEYRPQYNMRSNNVIAYRNDSRYNRSVYFGQRRGYEEPRPLYWAHAHGYNYRSHVYFPDYHVFYDAGRRGYVYQNRGQWIFSAVIPAIIAGVDLANARVEYMNGVPLNDNPEAYYNNYNNPPRVSLNVHVRL